MITVNWTNDANRGGHTGIATDGARQWKIYVLNNGSWTVYRFGSVLAIATGKAPSVSTAKSQARKAIAA